MKPQGGSGVAGPRKEWKGDKWLNIRVSEEFKIGFEEIAHSGGVSVSDLGRHACEDLIRRGKEDGKLQVRMGKGTLTIDMGKPNGKAA